MPIPGFTVLPALGVLGGAVVGVAVYLMSGKRGD